MNFKQLFSIPNLLCYFRIGMIPVFAYTYLQAETSADYLSSALILIPLLLGALGVPLPGLLWTK